MDFHNMVDNRTVTPNESVIHRYDSPIRDGEAAVVFRGPMGADVGKINGIGGVTGVLVGNGVAGVRQVGWAPNAALK